jgi:hypothetical protein
MSKQTINIGASPNDGTGTPLRTSFDYTNQNFTEIYTALGGGVALPGATTQVIFNDGGTNLAGDAGLVYNKTTDALTVAGLVTAGSATITGDLTVDTSTLKVDSTNNRVGIVNATPSFTLDVNGAGSSMCARISSGSGTGLRFDTTRNVGGLNRNYLIGPDLLNEGWFSIIPSTALGGGTFSNSIYNASSDGIHAWGNGAGGELMRLNTTGNLVLKDGTAAANGVGVTFPATQVASSDANCLDDYEEGTFLPNVQGSTTTGVGVYSTTDGRYTKVGRLVTAEIYIVWTAHTGTGDLRIGGLPFTANPSFYSAATIGLASNIALSASNTISAINQINATYINIVQSPVGGGVFSNVPMDVAGTMILSITYSV